MSFTVLKDDEVNAMLDDLRIDDLDEIRYVLAAALHEFSGNTQTPQDLFQQPPRMTTVHPDTQATSLYMPSCGPPGMACKIISMGTGKATEDPQLSTIKPTGVLNLFTPEGKPLGLIHARTLTAFRTALASSCLVARRRNVRTITVFGSGMQAFWHVRLALMMHGNTIKHVNVINHRFSENAGGLLKKLTGLQAVTQEREGWAHTKFGLLTPSFHEYKRLLKEQVRDADIIFCCTPSRYELFDASILTSHEGRRKGRLIVAVGSYTPEMRELPDGLLQQAVKHEKPHRHYHKHAQEGGVIIVDTLEGVLREAGEVIDARIGPQQLVELGELVMLHRQAAEESSLDASTPSSEFERLDIDDRSSSSTSSPFNDRHNGSQPASPSAHIDNDSRKPSFTFPFHRSSSSSDHQEKKDNELVQWLRDGNVIYKSVGLGLLDLVVGSVLMQVANDKGIGTKIEGFSI